MTKRQSGQKIDDELLDGLRCGNPQALVEQKLISAQNYVVVQRAAYNKALMHRAQCIALAHVAGWSKYRIAQRLGITRRAVDEALERPEISPAEFLAAQTAANGGHEDLPSRRLRELIELAPSVEPAAITPEPSAAPTDQDTHEDPHDAVPAPQIGPHCYTADQESRVLLYVRLGTESWQYIGHITPSGQPTGTWYATLADGTPVGVGLPIGHRHQALTGLLSAHNHARRSPH